MEKPIDIKNIIQQLHVLPISVQQQAVKYLQLLLKKHDTSSRVSPEPFRFDWAGGLEKETKSAVELQHKTSQLR